MRPRPPYRRTSLIAGVLYLLTFVSIPTLALYKNVRSAHYILGRGPDTAAITGGILELIVAVAGVGTAVVLFSVLRKQNETLAVGLLASRVIEASCIFVGVAVILTIVTLRQSHAGNDALVISRTLGALYDRVFLVSQSLLPAVNDVLLGALLLQSRLVPRALSVLALIAGPLLVIGFVLVMFGVVPQGGAVAGVSAIGVALFELLLGLWLVIRGFSPEAAAALDARREPGASGLA